MKEGFDRKRLIIMALGNIIGSGIFLGSSTVISLAGPAAILAYVLGGGIMAFEVMFVTEMSIINPAPGSFRVHTSEIFGPWIGFVNGWVFWLSGVLGMAGEVAAAAIFTQFFLPHVPLWIFCIIYACIMAVVNLNDLRGLSRVESVLASIKVIALVLFILFGLLVAFHIVRFDDFKLNDPFVSAQSFFPKGVPGFLASMMMVMFCYTGTGIIGLAIADTDNPQKEAPFAIAVIISFVVAIFALATLFIVVLTPWNSFSSNVSPFVQILQRMKIPYSGDILNFIVLTASLSGLNSAMYSSSRMLFSLSKDGQAPKLFSRTSKNKVPVFALMLSSAALLLTAILSYILPQAVFVILATASGILAMFNWVMVSVTHYFYRKKTLREHPEKIKFKAPGYPYTTFMEVVLLLAVLATSPFYPGQISGLVGSVIFFFALVVLYFLFRRLKVLK